MFAEQESQRTHTEPSVHAHRLPFSRQRTLRSRRPQWTPVPESSPSNKLWPASLNSLCCPAARNHTANWVCQVCADSSLPPSALPASTSVRVCVRTDWKGKQDEANPCSPPKAQNCFQNAEPRKSATSLSPPQSRIEPRAASASKENGENAVAVTQLRILLIAFSLPRRSERLERKRGGGGEEIERAVAVGRECDGEKNSTSVSAYFGLHCS